MNIGASDSRDPYKTQLVQIADVNIEIEGVATYTLVAAEEGPSADYTFKPGQFNMIYLPGVGESAISMSGDAFRGASWIHTIRVAGNVTAALAAKKIGDFVGLRGPFGRPWPTRELLGRDLVLVAGGLGLAPLRPLIYEIVKNRSSFGQVHLVVGARVPELLLYRTEYDAWDTVGLNVILTVDRASPGWAGSVGVVTPIIERISLPSPSNTSVITCGPEVMMRYVAESAIGRGTPVSHIWMSLERHMQCAAGFCGHCQLGPAFVCKDGPVFRYDVMRPFLFVESL